jgi:hypothetical protein
MQPAVEAPAVCLGVDPGWVNCGWSDGRQRHGVDRLVETMRPMPTPAVFNFGANLLAHHMAAETFGQRVRCVAIERQYRLFTHGELHAFLFAALAHRFPSAEVLLVSPLTIRKHFGWKGDQKTCARETAEKLGLPPGRTQHEVDSFLLARYAYSKSNTIL